MTDTNGLSALLGGYSGLLLGMLFVMILMMTFTQTGWIDMTPILMIMIISSLLIYYLYSNFEKITKGEVSGYYSGFSMLSTIFLLTQVIMISRGVYRNLQTQDIRMFDNTTFSLLGLFSVINMLIVLTIGIVLHFYSTQG